MGDSERQDMGMAPSITFTDWTYESVRDRVVEMARTLRLLPSVDGPRAFGNNMPEVVRRYDEAYGFEPARYRAKATASEIARMEECFGWINAYLDEEGRKLVYDYGFIKTRKGMYLDAYLNRLYRVRFTMAVDAVSQIVPEHTSTTVSSEKCATHWIASDGKPHVDPALAKSRVIKPRDIRARPST
jgi:hypothetical protein